MKVTIINCFDVYDRRVELLQGALCAEEHQVSVLIPNFRHVQKCMRTHCPEGVEMLPAKPYYGKFSPARIRSHIRFSKDAVVRARSLEPDLLWVLAPPNSLVKEAALYKRQRPEMKLILDFMDLWPESLPFPGFSATPFGRIWQGVRDKYVDAADSVVTERSQYWPVLQKSCDRKKLHTIAVIGPNADSREALIGNYMGTSSEYITPLEGIRQYAGEEIRVLYAQGCHLYKDQVEALAAKKDRFQEAVFAAERADAVIMCLGLDATLEGEEGDAGNAYAGGDKPDLRLPGLQQELLETVAATGKPVVLILLSGSAIDLSWADEHIDAVLQAWYPGARAGKAIAEAIFGAYSPSGRLPVTFYADAAQLPDFSDYSMENRTYRYTSCKILYPFGYGLSYTKIRYYDAAISHTRCSVKDTVTITAKITNEGSYPLHESVQAYIRHKDKKAYEPGFQLKGIQTFYIKPGETKQAEIKLQARDFAVITEEGTCVLCPGTYEISIGGCQPDGRSRELLGYETDVFLVQREGEEERIGY